MSPPARAALFAVFLLLAGKAVAQTLPEEPPAPEGPLPDPLARRAAPLSSNPLINAHNPEGSKAGAERSGLGFGFVPFVNFNSDWGAGAGAKAAVYWHAKGAQPYVLRVDGQAYMTSRGVHFHYVGFDVPRVFGTALRLDGSVWYTQSITENYCGLGGAASCSPARSFVAAERFLDEHGLDPSNRHWPAARTELARKYYQFRQTAPFAILNLRYAITSWLQFFAGYRFQYFVIRPYPLSQLAEELPLGARRGGPSSVPQLGLIFDNRDVEPAPTRGTFSEVSMRVSSKAMLSGYDWVGINATLRGWAPLTPGGGVVFAARIVADAMFGNVPFYELSSIGGSDPISGIGGERTVRGVRVSRFRGKGKFIFSPELRVTWTRFHLNLLGLGTPEIDVGNVVFMDIGRALADWPGGRVRGGALELAWGDERPITDVVWGTGVGLRIGINRVFILKGDIAVSPHEPGWPGVYMNVGHVF